MTIEERERCLAADRRYLEKNRERINARNRAAYAANPEKHRAITRKNRNRHLAKARARVRAWHKANPEKVRASTKAWRAANPDRVRAQFRRLRYGVTREEFEAMLVEQDGKCAICRKPPPAGRVLEVDHDHRTMKVRGLLCGACNRRVGHYEHPDHDRILSYLRKHGSR